MKISDRKKQILRAVVEQFIETAEPVGSKAISTELSLSSATIRNEMAALEEAGFLEQPHTSAGRIPTTLGYRIYVDELMKQHRLSIDETRQLNRALEHKLSELDRIINYAGQTASQITSLPAYALSRFRSNKEFAQVVRFDLIEVDARSFIAVLLLDNEIIENKLFHVAEPLAKGALKRIGAVLNVSFTGIHEKDITTQLITNLERVCGDRQGIIAMIAAFVIQALQDRSKVEYALMGSARLLDHPEYRDIDKAQRLLDFLSDEEIAAELPMPEEDSKAKITIGPENLAKELSDSSVVVTRYEIDGETELLIGVVGPTRMDYSRILSRLQYLVRGLGEGLDNPSGFRLPDKF